MATFNNSGAYSILNTQKGIYYVQAGHYFSPTTFVDLGTTAPTDYQSLSSERSDQVSITGGALDGVTVGPNSTINAAVSGSVANATITGSTITGGSINGTPIGQITPAAGAFLGLNATSAGILGPLIAEGVSSSANAQAPSPTNSGITWGSSPTWAMQSFYDQSNTANNRSADMLFISGAIKFRFANDARSAFLDVFSITGGQASGVTGITSTSGTGDWAHTGNLTATNYVGSLDTGTLPGFSGSSGAFLYAGNGFESLMLQRIGNTAGNRRAYVGYSGSGLALGFFNDQSGTQTPAISVAGGAASGITSITFGNGSSVPFLWSGNGPWTVGGSTGTSGQVFTSQGNALNPAWSSSIGVSGVVDAGGGLRVKEGANAKQGIATLVAGTVTVANTSVTANSRIQLTVQSLGTVTRPAAVGVTARVAGTSFTITSGDATDTSVVAYEIFEPGA